MHKFKRRFPILLSLQFLSKETSSPETNRTMESIRLKKSFKSREKKKNGCDFSTGNLIPSKAEFPQSQIKLKAIKIMGHNHSKQTNFFTFAGHNCLHFFIKFKSVIKAAVKVRRPCFALLLSGQK